MGVYICPQYEHFHMSNSSGRIILNIIMAQRQNQCQHDLTSCCSWSPDVTIGGYISSEILNSLCIQCILNCILQNVKMTLHSTPLGHQMPLQGVHLIWNFELTVYPMHSQLHSLLRVHLIWKYKNVKMTLCSTPLGHQMPLPGGQLVWGYISSENMSSLQNLLLLHRGLFYKRPIKKRILTCMAIYDVN